MDYPEYAARTEKSTSCLHGGYEIGGSIMYAWLLPSSYRAYFCSHFPKKENRHEQLY